MGGWQIFLYFLLIAVLWLDVAIMIIRIEKQEKQAKLMQNRVKALDDKIEDLRYELKGDLAYFIKASFDNRTGKKNGKDHD